MTIPETFDEHWELDDNPRCVNPDHLFLGSPGDNIRDMVSKGRNRHPAGTKHPRASLSTESLRLLRSLSASGLTQRIIARKLGVSQATVSNALNAKCYSKE